jgi:hypothetical protein
VLVACQHSTSEPAVQLAQVRKGALVAGHPGKSLVPSSEAAGVCAQSAQPKCMLDNKTVKRDILREAFTLGLEKAGLRARPIGQGIGSELGFPTSRDTVFASDFAQRVAVPLPPFYTPATSSSALHT